jgi:myosin heavy subunit
MQLVRTKLKEYESEMEQTITDMDNQQNRIDEQKAELDNAMRRAADVERETSSLRAREEVVRKNQLKYQELIDQAQEMIKNTSAKEEKLKSRIEELEMAQRQNLEKERSLRVNESQVDALLKKLQSEQDRLLVQETEIEEYASQLDKTRDALQIKEEQLKIEGQKAESRTASAEKMIRESLEKMKENQELEMKLEQSKAAFELEKQFIHEHIQSIEAKEIEIDAKEKTLLQSIEAKEIEIDAKEKNLLQSIEAKEIEIDAKEKTLLHQQNVEFRKRMENLDREYQSKAAALEERIAAVHDFDLSHVEKISRQESKIEALEQQVQTLQTTLLEKDVQIVALTENRPNKQGPMGLSIIQQSREALVTSAKQIEGFRLNLKDLAPTDTAIFGSSKISSTLLPEIHVQSEKELEPTPIAQKRTMDHISNTKIEFIAADAMELQNSEALNGLEGPFVHQSSMRSGLSGISAASLRNRDFPSLSQSNMFMTPQTSRILDQHTKSLSYSLQKHAPEVSHEFSSSMASISGNESSFARTQLHMPRETIQESSKSAAFSAEVDEMQRKIGRRLDALRESRLQKSEGKF